MSTHEAQLVCKIKSDSILLTATLEITHIYQVMCTCSRLIHQAAGDQVRSAEREARVGGGKWYSRGLVLYFFLLKNVNQVSLNLPSSLHTFETHPYVFSEKLSSESTRQFHI